MGPAHDIRSVAESLHPYHPDYYFLVDRDHHSDETVERSWESFPQPDTHNLLLWRRREIENYFIDPAFASSSGYLACPPDELRRRLLRIAQRRLHLDAVRLTIVRVREELKRRWIELPSDPRRFMTREKAREWLEAQSAFGEQRKRTSRICSVRFLRSAFDEEVDRLTGGGDRLTYERGGWLYLMRGKELMAELFNQCFEVVDTAENRVTGRQKERDIAVELIRRGDRLPDDFVELRRLMKDRVSGAR